MVDGEFLSLDHGFIKTWRPHHDRVHADGKIQYLIGSGIVGHRIPVDVRAGVGHCDLRAGDGGALRIGDRADHATIRGLSEGANSNHQRGQNQSKREPLHAAH